MALIERGAIYHCLFTRKGRWLFRHPLLRRFLHLLRSFFKWHSVRLSSSNQQKHTEAVYRWMMFKVAVNCIWSLASYNVEYFVTLIFFNTDKDADYFDWILLLYDRKWLQELLTTRLIGFYVKNPLQGGLLTFTSPFELKLLEMNSTSTNFSRQFTPVSFDNLIKAISQQKMSSIIP